MTVLTSTVINNAEIKDKIYYIWDDIDELCVCMTYTQLSLLGLSVRVIHGNSLSGEIFSTWDSPNLQMANLAGYFN